MFSIATIIVLLPDNPGVNVVAMKLDMAGQLDTNFGTRFIPSREVVICRRTGG